MNNVHEDHPVVFQTRWTLSYLRGPLTREQIQTLMRERKKKSADDPGPAAGTRLADAAPPDLASASAAKTDASAGATASAVSVADARPVVPPGIVEVFLTAEVPLKAGERLEYRPALLGRAKLHYVAAKNGVDQWSRRIALVPAEQCAAGDPWSAATWIEKDLPEGESSTQGTFAAIPGDWTNAKSFAKLAAGFKNSLYGTAALILWNCKSDGQTSRPEESEADFRNRLSQAAREERDAMVEKLRNAFKTKQAALEEQIRKAEQRVATEKAQASSQTWKTVVSAGQAILSAVMGRKLASQANIRRIATVSNSATCAYEQHQDIGRAAETAGAYRAKLDQLAADLQDQIAAADASVRADAFALEEIRIAPARPISRSNGSCWPGPPGMWTPAEGPNRR